MAYILSWLGNAAISGLSWNGDPSSQRSIIFSNPQSNGLPIYPATYIWKVYQRQQVSTRADGSRYYTTFFWGNNGAFSWDVGRGANTYYGAHPYPSPPNTGDGKWEISCASQDPVTRDDASSPFATVNRWYSQALVVSHVSTNYNHKFYIDLPSTATSDTITFNFTQGDDSLWNSSNPPSPCLIWGQAPDDGFGKSWGGYDQWEEQNAIIRGVQVYNAALSETDITALSAFDQNADVISYCSGHSITSLWYLNMNWTLSDITDKSGNGHNFSWNGAGRPAAWP